MKATVQLALSVVSGRQGAASTCALCLWRRGAPQPPGQPPSHQEAFSLAGGKREEVLPQDTVSQHSTWQGKEHGALCMNPEGLPPWGEAALPRWGL